MLNQIDLGSNRAKLAKAYVKLSGPRSV